MALLETIRGFTNGSILIQLAIIISAVKLAGILSDKLKQPTVFGKLLVGILLGPSILGIVTETDTLKTLSELGVIMLMFLAGLETDVQEFKKAGVASTLTAMGGVLLPLGIGALYCLQVGYTGIVPLFIGTVLTATSVSISAQTLRELGWLKSKVGITILGAAVIDDILGIIVLTLVLGIAGVGGASEVTILIAKMAIFFVVSIFVGRLVIPPVLKWMHNTPVSHGLTAAALVFVFLFSFAAEASGVAAITGAYIAGILMGMTRYKEEITEKSEALGYSFLVPIFFASIGLSAKISALSGSLYFIVILCLIAILTKIVGAGLGAKIAGFNARDSFIIGNGMVSRGEIALIIASIGLNRNIIDQDLFTAIVVMVLVTTIVTPPVLKVLIDRRRKAESL